MDACIREVLEETAYDFEPEALVGIYLNRFTRTGDDILPALCFCGRVGTHHSWRQLDDGIVRPVADAGRNPRLPRAPPQPAAAAVP